MKNIFLFLVLFSLDALADASFKKGLGLSPSLGYTYTEIENPDNTKSNYDGFVIQLDFVIPIYRTSLANFDLHLLYKNSAVDNLSNNENLSEDAKFYGPGAGLSFAYKNFGLGAIYNWMSADHSTSGIYSQNTKYKFNTLTYYIDLAKHDSQFSFGGRIGYEAGNIEKSQTQYSKDVSYTAMTGWIYFTYVTNFALF